MSAQPVSPPAIRPAPAIPAGVLLLDLETDPQGTRILSAGAVVGGREGRWRAGTDLTGWLAAQAEGAEAVAGHNVLDHDLPTLRNAGAGGPLAHLPVVDTLLWSPLCFPENPYHRLVKDYKLVSVARNDPVADARLAGVLLADEIASLRGLAEAEPDAAIALRWLLTRSAADGPGPLTPGAAWMFAAAAPDLPEVWDEDGPSLLQDVVSRHGTCQAAVARIGPEDLAVPARRWAWAYALTWLRVAGGTSVLPPWVRIRFPEVPDILHRLREVPCGDAGCAWCGEVHDPERQLKTIFGFDTFRPTPADATGGSLQRAVSLAGMRGEPLLAVMPTGGGKSLCFQLPALVRNRRRGVLTVVVSPLQALMKDQVDGLIRRTNEPRVAALNGLLTPPERGAVLRRIVMGDLAMVYLSPEQLRSRRVKDALRQREIGSWVLDEAHCLSKWGHDFRPDYLYVAKVIAELAGSGPPPPVSCFTATAKHEVIREIQAHFREETGQALAFYEGGVERENLSYEVQLVTAYGKLPRIEELLRERLGETGTGSAVVFRATRTKAEGTARYLAERGWRAEHFHAGLLAPEKKRIQDAFLGDGIQVICATNAFGMGIDKDNVRLVIHGDVPGSVENYLQEAGRAGRDRAPAECVLLYDEEDTDQQFGLEAHSQLSRKDIAQILRGLRKAAGMRPGETEIVLSSGDLLRDRELEISIDVRDRMADTKVRTAISWLERAGYLDRTENRTRVIQARPVVRSEREARTKMAGLNLSDFEQARWLAILRELWAADETESLSVDELALLPEFAPAEWQGEPIGGGTGVPARLREGESLEQPEAGSPNGAGSDPSGSGHLRRRAGTPVPRPEAPLGTGSPQQPPDVQALRILKTLDAMVARGLLKKSMLLSAFLRYKVTDHCGLRLAAAVRLENALLDLMQELAPDPENWLALDLRLLNQELISRGEETSVESLRRLLDSLSEDGRGLAGQVGSLELRSVGRDRFRVRLRRDWPKLREVARRRQEVAGRILERILASVPPGAPARADLRVEFAFEDLEDAVRADMLLMQGLRDPPAAVERALLYLHEQGVIILQRGLAVFRSAMTIRLRPERKGQRYTQDEYAPLTHHYDEKRFQIHVMGEYARRGMQAMREALKLVLDYFTLDRAAFIRRYFGDREEMLRRAASAGAWRRIVEDLRNRDQARIVTAPIERDLLVLAGPGSGKTRVVVHRCAYLIQVKHVPARRILVCCFNHQAAVELRRRLRELVGEPARHVMVQTYHGLALRLLGRACTGNGGETPDFEAMIRDAVALLRGETALPGLEPDEIRDRLLAGYDHILVDEYQDIDEPQYDLIGALAGRNQDDPDTKLTLLAVGDDDQSIYGWRGANVAFIRRFEADYGAETQHLVENYRSTGHIIEAANRLIGRNRDRMKTRHPIRIDSARRRQPPGGAFGAADPLTRGRVSVVPVRDAPAQARAVAEEVVRLRGLGARFEDMAVLSRNREDLARVRAALAARDIPFSWPLDRERLPSLARMREIRAGLDTLEVMRDEEHTAGELRARLGLEAPDGNPWRRVLADVLVAWDEETGSEMVPVRETLAYVQEALAQRRREEQIGEGVILRTVHGAKGTETDHVLVVGDWSKGGEEERRVLYVAMTRARRSLALFHRADRRSPLFRDLDGPCFVARSPAVDLGPEPAEALAYEMLGPKELFLSFAGQHALEHPLHRALAALGPGSALELVPSGQGLALRCPGGESVARLSAEAARTWLPRLAHVVEVEVLGLFVRRREDDKQPEFADRLLADRWELPLCEVAYRAR